MVTECCISGFQWDGTPTGKEGRIAENDTYVVGESQKVAILVIAGMLEYGYRSSAPCCRPSILNCLPLTDCDHADLFGWTFTNTRLLCDAYAAETPATVYMPDLSVPATVSFPRSLLKLSLAALAAKSSTPRSSPTRIAGTNSTLPLGASVTRRTCAGLRFWL